MEMSRILISIKPEYVERILNETKKFEFRRMITQKEVKLLVIYSTRPVMEIVAEVEVIETIEMAPSSLWEKTKKSAGISRKKYREYFRGRKKAYAYVLGRVTKYEAGKKLTDIGIEKAPQSFLYLNQKQYETLRKAGDT